MQIVHCFRGWYKDSSASVKMVLNKKMGCCQSRYTRIKSERQLLTSTLPLFYLPLNKTSPFYSSIIQEHGPHHALLFKTYPKPFDEKIQIGLAGFTDWAEPNSSLFYCYKLVDTTFGLGYYGNVPKNILPDKDTDGWDSSLNAVYFTAIDKDQKWNSA